MARSHHRKKHKNSLRQFRHSHDSSTSAGPRGRTRAATLFTIVGALTGFAICYFASQGALLWLGLGLVAGGAAGYLIGKKIDRENAR